MSIWGNRLRFLRQRKGVSQADLAGKVSLSIRQISRYESEGGALSSTSLIRLAQALDVSADYLLGLSESPDSPARPVNLLADELLVLDAYRQGGWLRVMQLAVEQVIQQQEDTIRNVD